jgi:hypothetical protein
MHSGDPSGAAGRQRGGGVILDLIMLAVGVAMGWGAAWWMSRRDRKKDKP